MNILIIDDERNIRQTLQEYLEEQGHKLYSVPDGGIALRVLDEHEIDLAITDIQLPDMDGFMVLQAIKARYPDMPVIVITGFADKCSAIKALIVFGCVTLLFAEHSRPA